MRNLMRAASMAVLSTVVMPVAAHAQAPAEQTSLVDEIVVTANKREQSLQDVPVVVTAIGEQALKDGGVRDIKDLMQLTPGLMVSSTANESTTIARIRGIGTVGDNAGLESSVGIVIDGVYRPRAATGIGDLGEMQRVEVLKGPQGTLFGKNTSAGVINVLTAEPSFQFGATGEITAGNYNAREVSGSITGPIIGEVLAGRLYLADRQRDGFYDVRVGDGPRTRTEDNNRNYWTARGQLLFLPTDDFTVRVIADYTQRDESCCAAVTYVRGPGAAALDLAAGTTTTLNPIDPERRLAYANRDGINHVTDKGLSGEFTWDTPWFGGATATFITAWRNWKTSLGQDSDFSAGDLIYRLDDGNFFTQFDQLSHEIRYAGATDKLNWLVGLFYAKEQLDQGTPVYFGEDLERFLSLRFSGNTNPNRLSELAGVPVGSVFPSGGGYNDRYRQTSTSLALFTNNSYAFTDKLELTVGLRYTSEEKKLSADYDNVGGGGLGCAASLARRPEITAALGAGGAASYFGAVCATMNDPAFDNYSTKQSQSADELTGTVKLAYRINPDFLTYGSFARSYKSGGFNLDRARQSPGVRQDVPDTFFDPEFVDSYELGLKATLLNGDLLLNTAVFYQEFTDFQLNTYDGISYKVASIPLVVSRGVDTDFVWRTPIDGLRLQGGVTYAETQYGDFVPEPGVSPRLPNSRMSGAPLWSSSLSGSYERDLTESLAFRGSLSVRYTSSYNTGSDLNPIKVQDGFAQVNARIGIGAPDKRWEVELWGANLTDETVAQVIFDPAFQTGSYNAIWAPPRTYGVTLRSTF
ncbi:MAG: TonB-dependent receptor [Pseudomonadota bacterium]